MSTSHRQCLNYRQIYSNRESSDTSNCTWYGPPPDGEWSGPPWPGQTTHLQHASPAARRLAWWQQQPSPGCIPPVLPTAPQHGHPAQPGLSTPQPQREASPPPSAHPLDTLRRASTDPDRELQDTTARDPLPDLLPQRDRSPQASPQHRAPGVADPRLDDEVVELVANQLKRIGDDLNATIVQRMGGIPQRQGWRGLCLGVLRFLSDTLSSLHRLR
ncbi:uncharacterized protein LOC135559670 [Oncorhynchus nerka]|uniref:uncharacterized protein LOC135559670 n=1 Tax=Oncorhynchus nerka TaxID=8023 RepID=UPI0031B80751